MLPVWIRSASCVPLYDHASSPEIPQGKPANGSLPMKVFSSSDPQRRTGLEKQKFMVFPVCHSGVLSVGLPQEIGVFRQKVEIESSGSSVVGFRTKKGFGILPRKFQATFRKRPRFAVSSWSFLRRCPRSFLAQIAGTKDSRLTGWSDSDWTGHKSLPDTRHPQKKPKISHSEQIVVDI